MVWYRVHGPPVDFNGSVYIVRAAHSIGRKRAGEEIDGFSV
jgi:hypothetical protein